MKKTLLLLEYLLLCGFPVVFFFISKITNLKPKNWPLFLLILLVWSVVTILFTKFAENRSEK